LDQSVKAFLADVGGKGAAAFISDALGGGTANA
jgi:hypothetical protein